MQLERGYAGRRRAACERFLHASRIVALAVRVVFTARCGRPAKASRASARTLQDSAEPLVRTAGNGAVAPRTRLRDRSGPPAAVRVRRTRPVRIALLAVVAVSAAAACRHTRLCIRGPVASRLR